MNERDIFLDALEIEDPQARLEYLQRVCGDDAELLARVNALLASHEGQSEFLRTPVVEQLDKAADAFAQTSLLDESNKVDGQHTEQLETNQNSREEDDEVPLDFLQPSTQPDSLGRLGHYEILEVVGRGAFGTVLRAFDEKLQRVVAVKVLSPEMAATSPARKRFLREARTSAQIRHENVVGVYAVEQEPTPHLVMEYIAGKTLQQRLDERGPLNLTDVLRLGKQIADGLAAAHEQDLIHRDIKPGNILLEGGMDERVKITDFGLARTADDASMSQSGVIAGTPMYMAPEQAHGQKLDQRADLFSLGSVLYQMLSGRPPFRAPTTMAVLKRVTEDTPRPIPEIIPETPTWMCELIGHLHAKNPENRYSSAKEVSELLAKCAKEVEAGRTPAIPNPARTSAETVRFAGSSRSITKSFLQSSVARGVAVVLVMLMGLGITEATGVTKITNTVIRWTTPHGILVIQTNDPSIKIAVDGEDITIQGGGIGEISLRPGDYKLAARKNGELVKEELITIIRDGRTVVQVGLSAELKDASPSKGAAAPGNAERQSQHVASGEWIDVIPLIDPKLDTIDLPSFTGKNEWLVKNGELLVGHADRRTNKLLLPLDGAWQSFECKLEVTRRVGNIGFCFNIPSAAGDFPVVFDWPGRPGHFIGSSAKGAQISKVPAVETGKPITFRLEVRVNEAGDQVKIWRNGIFLGEWHGRRNATTRLDPRLPADRRASLYVWGGGSEYVFHRIRIRTLDESTMTLLRPAAANAPFQWPTAAPPPAIAPFDAKQAQQHQRIWADYLKVPVEQEIVVGQNDRGEDVTLTMVLIPPGEFLMGSTSEEQEKLVEQSKTFPSEQPQHRVRITRPFYLGREEVTQDQWLTLMINQPSKYRDNLQRPVANLDRDQIESFLRKLNEKVVSPTARFVLPTEAQWEYACRAGTTTPWFSGDSEEGLREYGWFRLNELDPGRSHPVGSCRANAFGLHDMHGNVWEWCADWFEDDFYSWSPEIDPIGPPSGKSGVLRGGSFGVPAFSCRSAVRLAHSPELPLGGFRVAVAVTDERLESKSVAIAGAIERKILPRPTDNGPSPSMAYDVLTSDEYEWTPAEKLGPQINSVEGEESDPWISHDGLTLLFTSRRDTGTDYDIWQSTRASVDDDWSEAVPLSINSEAADGLARMSGDGLAMVFVSRRPGGLGDWDLWFTTRKSPKDGWETPVNLGTHINSSGGDFYPQLSNDGLRLTYRRDRQFCVTMRKSTNDRWLTPLTLAGHPGVRAYVGPSQLLDSDWTLLGSQNGSGSFVARWDPGRQHWEEQISLPLSINNGREFAKPFFNLTTKTLYFEYGSDGWRNRDLWMSRRIPKKAVIEGEPDSRSEESQSSSRQAP